MVRKAEELGEEARLAARSASSRTRPIRRVHRSTTGPEILSDFSAGRRLDFFCVSGWRHRRLTTATGADESSSRAGRGGDSSQLRAPGGAAATSGKPFTPQDPGLDPGSSCQLAAVRQGREPDPAGHRHRGDEGACVRWRTAGILRRHSPAAAPAARCLRSRSDARGGSVILAMLPDTGERLSLDRCWRTSSRERPGAKERSSGGDLRRS